MGFKQATALQSCKIWKKIKKSHIFGFKYIKVATVVNDLDYSELLGHNIMKKNHRVSKEYEKYQYFKLKTTKFLHFDP